MPALIVLVVIGSSAVGFSRNAGQPAVGVELDQAEGARVGDRHQEDRRARSARLVEPAHGGEVGVGQDVAVEHEDGAAREIGGVPNAPAGAERLGLDHVAQPHSQLLAIAQGLPHVVDAVRARQDDVGHAVLAQQGELVGQERHAEQRDDGLRAGEGQRPQARALAAGEDDGLGRALYVPGDQGWASLISITGMSSRIA